MRNKLDRCYHGLKVIFSEVQTEQEIEKDSALLNDTSFSRSRGGRFNSRLRSSFDYRICAVKVRFRIGGKETRLRRQTTSHNTVF